jgi:hypothetical protein
MSSSSVPHDEPAAADLQTTRQLLDDLRRSVNETIDAATAQVDALLAGAGPAALTPRRPAAVPPRRLEQRTRTPEPTADLDDLVDVLAPRLLERLVPALRDALRDDS